MALAHHIGLGPEHLDGNAGLGRYVLLPGDPARARKIAEHFGSLETIDNARGHHAHLGTLAPNPGNPPIDVLALSTGMGSGSTEIIVHELISCGARRLLRVGSCGSMNEIVRPGGVVIALGAVRDEKTSHDYAPPQFPALAHPDAVQALFAGARVSGLANECFAGICHSKASFYGREYGHGPAGKANREYTSWLKRCGVIATEMEASTLFVLAATANPKPASIADHAVTESCRAGAVLAVYASDDPDRKFRPAVAAEAEAKVIRIAIAGIKAWAGMTEIA